MKHLRAKTYCPYEGKHYQKGELIRNVSESDAALLVSLKRAEVVASDVETREQSENPDETSPEATTESPDETPDAASPESDKPRSRRQYARRDLTPEN